MRKKFRACLKAEYLLISGYVVFTIFLIVALSYVITKIDVIFLWATKMIRNFFELRHRFLSVP